MNNKFIIREAFLDEYEEVGKLMVNVYSNLEGFPSQKEQPSYYNTLSNIGEFAGLPKVRLLVALDVLKKVSGAVVYFGDMKYYGSGGTATSEKNAAGFRLLAVDFNARGNNLGKKLTLACINFAKKEQQKQLIIHTTNTMQIAWKMYEKIGFKRAKELDFLQQDFPVFGFRLIF